MGWDRTDTKGAFALGAVFAGFYAATALVVNACFKFFSETPRKLWNKIDWIACGSLIGITVIYNCIDSLVNKKRNADIANALNGIDQDNSVNSGATQETAHASSNKLDPFKETKVATGQTMPEESHHFQKKLAADRMQPHQETAR